MNDRRRFLAAGCAFTSLLSACGRADNWPAGMKPIKWDRDTCARCRMVISDRRFATEIGSATSDAVFKFDDVGCAMRWQRDKAQEHPWMSDPATRLWVADVASDGNDATWLDARAAHYVSKTSPMGYNFGASAHDQPGAVDFQTMREHVLLRKE
jgi:nitrous oxide reductase accessory protein NosL